MLTPGVEHGPDGNCINTASFKTSQIESIPPDFVIERLELTGLSRPLLDSVRGRAWFSLNDGKILLEARSRAVMQQAREGKLHFIDFDDCLMSATGWHKREYELTEQAEFLRGRGVSISAARARETYELSKIHIPGVAEIEPRYTPKLNLILLSRYSEALQYREATDQFDAQAWGETLSWRETINAQVQSLGERVLQAYTVDPEIQEMFLGNSPSTFLYRDFVQDLLLYSSPDDIRMIATRGKIEGPLGQVYKVHSSGLMRQRSFRGQGVDLVLYSNDVKAEALMLVMDILPGIRERLVTVYDDNPKEVVPYLEAIQRRGARNMDVVQVSHPDAKRKDAQIGIAPYLDYPRRGTRFRHYALFPEQASHLVAVS